MLFGDGNEFLRTILCKRYMGPSLHTCRNIVQIQRTCKIFKISYKSLDRLLDQFTCKVLLISYPRAKTISKQLRKSMNIQGVTKVWAS